jgi:hypothetical protein
MTVVTTRRVPQIGSSPEAIAKAGLRETVITPTMGAAAGHVISTITLCAAILLLTFLTIGWIRPRSSGDTWAIGGLWFGLTAAFEFLAGHYLFGNPWSRLLEDYNVFRAGSGCSSCSRPRWRLSYVYVLAA